MASFSDTPSMALFCDFENVALGVRDAKYDKFDIKPVLERLLLKGSIVVKKAYCDWERYRGFKAAMHEANFELIEIPHVRQSGKNSADIRMVVDALDLCYTKSHVNTFVIISGDSDFSPLVSKLRENAKRVIGVGVKDSTSDLLVANCDEFIFYDELVHDRRRAASTRADARESAPSQRRDDDRARREDLERRRLQGVEIAYETFEALAAERGDSGKIWASVLKEAIKRRNPGFSEGAYGFRTFGNLLEEAQALRLLGFGRDEKSGAYVFRGAAAGSVPVAPPSGVEEATPGPMAEDLPDSPASGVPADTGDGIPATHTVEAGSEASSGASRRRGGRRGRKDMGASAPGDGTPAVPSEPRIVPSQPPEEPEDRGEPGSAPAPARRSYFERPAAAGPMTAEADASPAGTETPVAAQPESGPAGLGEEATQATDTTEPGKPARRTATRTAPKAPGKTAARKAPAKRTRATKAAPAEDVPPPEAD